MSTYTTTRLALPATAPLPAPPSYRRAASAIVLAIGTLAIVVSLAWREEHQHDRAAAPVVEPQIVFIIATPSPLPPTSAPAVLVAAPTAAPQIVYQTVEVPVEVYIEVSSAPVAHDEEWHPPLVAPDDLCATWHPPMARIAGCP